MDQRFHSARLRGSVAPCDSVASVCSVASVRLAILSTTVAVAALGAQAPPDRPPQSTFRGGVQFVRVDAYPSRDGVPVTDLTAAEFEIFEDGVPQTIEAFEHVRVPPGGPEALRVQPNSIRAADQMAADPRARVFVLFLDSYHMDTQQAQQMRVPVRRFLEEALGPDDLIAVTTPETTIRSLTFSRKTEVISRVLDQTMEWMLRDRTMSAQAVRAMDEVERLYERCYGLASAMILRRREKLTLDALSDLIAHLGAVRDERKSVMVVTLGWELYGPDASLAERDQRQGPPPIAPVDRLRGGRERDGAGLSPSSEMVACEADRMALAHLDHRERMREITGDANRANVSFYPFTPLRNPAFSPAGGLAQLSTLREMAENTDGLAIVNTNNIAEPMRRVIEDMSSYYLLGYQSTNAKLDGRFRSIRVTVKRPGVQVRARRGYRAVRAEEAAAAVAAARPAARADSAVETAISRLASVTTHVPLRLRATGWRRSLDAGGDAMLWVVGDLDAATRRDPAWKSGATADIAVLGSSGREVRHTARVETGTGAFAVRVPDVGDLAAGEYGVRVMLRPAGPGGAPVSDIVTASIPASPALGEPVLLRRGPATGTRYVETADLRVRRTERLRLELPTSSAASAEARVVDRAGKPMQVPAAVSTRQDASGFTWVVVDVSLAPFAPGDYAVVVTQESATQVTGVKVVP